MFRILFIDDDKAAHTTLKMVLPPEYTVISSMWGGRGVQLAAERSPDVVLLDINLPDMDGFEVLEKIHALPVPPPIVMLTGFDEIDVVVKAIRRGARDYLVKPYNLERLKSALENAIAARKPVHSDHSALTGIIGESPLVLQAKRLIETYARSSSSVLLYGESGTGKELAARAIHALSKRKERPFVARNCGAIPEPLLETEMFGAEKGAYTDATSRAGSFEQADGGTLFLDEIGELPRTSQVKLLRVLEEGFCTRLGGTARIPIDVRVVSATNRNLKTDVDTGSFRNDLYYRINTLPILIPALRQRKEDIPLLIRHFMNGFDEERTITQSAWERLHEYEWPGNIRELRSVVERALLLSDGGPIDADSIRFE